jgi:hypothetical protein
MELVVLVGRTIFVLGYIFRVTVVCGCGFVAGIVDPVADCIFVGNHADSPLDVGENQPFGGVYIVIIEVDSVLADDVGPRGQGVDGIMEEFLGDDLKVSLDGMREVLLPR